MKGEATKDEDDLNGKRWPYRFDIIDDNDGGVYLTRWTLVKLFGWSLKLHWIRRPDKDRCQHDHPWDFWTLCLWGGYEEEVPVKNDPCFTSTDNRTTRISTVRPMGLYYRRADYRHRITKLPSGSAVTLVVTSPVRQHWGFWVNNRWIYWREFLNTSLGTRVAWCGTDDSRTPIGLTTGDN